MGKDNFHAMSLEDAHDVIHELRKDIAHHEQLLEQLSASYLLQAERLLRVERLLQLERQGEPSWQPSQRTGAVFEPAQAPCNVKRIQARQTQSHDIVARLRTTWPGRIYVSHLKRIFFIRWSVQWVLRNGYPIYTRYISTLLFKRNAKRWRSLIKLSDVASNSKLPTYKLADAVCVETTVPRVFPVSDQIHLVAPHDQYTFPEIFVANIKNALVYGGTNLVLLNGKNGKVVSHDLYDFERDATSEELHNRTHIDPKAGRIRWLLNDEAPEQVQVAASFVDACASNYAHWMTEVLPRIALFCGEERFHGVPIVVDDGLHKNIMESLFLVAGDGREIITLPIGRALAVDELYVTSVAGYVPFGRRTNKLTGHSHGVFSPSAFKILRDRLEELATKTEEAWPQKIFLRRNTGARKLTNMAELEKLLIARGYVIVEPEKMTFAQQIQLFHNAKVIVAPTGAALASAIACKPGTQVAVLMSKHEEMIYRYWYDMLTPLQIKVGYVLGNIVENQDLGIHGDFAIDPGCLNDLLESVGNK